MARIRTMEDISGRLGDYGDNMRDLNNILQRAEDKLSSADKASKDPKVLDKIKVSPIPNQVSNNCKLSREI